MRDDVRHPPLRVEELGFDAAGGAVLLAGVTFALCAGGVTAVLGPNGSGKSLLLRLCHGLLRPSRGRVLWSAIHDQTIGTTLEPHRRRHAMVFQKPVMLRRSVRSNIAHALGAIGHYDTKDRRDEALERFGLVPLADRPARLLSGGEQQRLAIARAWALDPEVLFLDEPTAQLDPGATRAIEMLIEGLVAEGRTVVLTTHDFGQARRLARHVFFLNRGRLVEIADAATFFAGPTTPAAKAFLAGDLVW